MKILKYKDGQGNWVSVPALIGPKGDKGDDGEKGDKGDRGDKVIIASKYSELTFPVAEGTYCLYNDVPYVANQTISTSEAWTAAHWDQVSFEDEIGELKNALQDIEDAITEEIKGKNLIDPSKLIAGKISSNGAISSSGLTMYKTLDYIWMEPGSYIFARESLSDDTAKAMGYSGYCLYNSEKVFIDGSYVWENFGSVTVPITITESCYLRLSGNKDYFTDNTTALFILQTGTTLDGWEAYVEPYTEIIALTQNDIEQNFGQSTDKVLSQKVVTDAVGGVPNVTGKESLINLYDKTLAVDGKYINSGSVVTNADWAYTGLIPVKPNTQYNISYSTDAPLPGATAVYAYRADKSYIGTIPLISYVYGYLLAFITTSETYYIARNYNKANHTQAEFTETIDTVMLCYGTQRPKTYVPYNKETVLLSEKLGDSYFNPNVFKQKRWLACGTSITWYDSKKYQYGQHADEVCRGYVGNVARRKALLVTNDGISGSTLALTTSEKALINRYQSLDWANSDIATLEYGVNDFGQAVDIGTAEDAPGTTTFAACLKTVIEYALTQNPKLCLVICTEPDVRGDTANSGGHYLYEYTDVTLAIAKQYRLPVCDWYYHSGINAVTKGNSSTDMLTADGTHPNDAGHLRMGAMLNQVFDSLIC